MGPFFLWIYRLLGYLLYPFFLLKNPPPERKGFLPQAEIWVHAASVGEAAVAAAIIKALKRIRPRSKVLLTLQTQTGIKKAQELIGDLASVSFAPYDLAPWVKRAFRQVSPKILVPVETELWPNLLEEAQRQKVVLTLVNGRLSARSFRNYRFVRPLLQRLLAHFSALGVIGPKEAQRFANLGASEEKVFPLGNAKYDLLLERIRQKKDPFLDSSKRWIVFGSIRRGEEKAAVESLFQIQRSLARVGFVLAPRHLNLIPKIESELEKRGLSYGKWSQTRKEQILLLDEIGPLLSIYSQATVAFVGGSLVPKGGQNPLEPAAFRVPIAFGPHMDNFPYEAEALIQKGGGKRIKNTQELTSTLLYWLEHEKERALAGKAAYQVFLSFLGASKRYAELIIKSLNHLPLLDFPSFKR